MTSMEFYYSKEKGKSFQSNKISENKLDKKRAKSWRPKGVFSFKKIIQEAGFIYGCFLHYDIHSSKLRVGSVMGGACES